MATSIKDAILKYKANINFESAGDVIYEDTEEYDATNENTTTFPDITFKVQIAASSRKLKTKPYNFKGLKDISRDKTGKIYKYFYGATSDYSMIKEQKKKAYKKGYITCFVVAFKNGAPISLADALKRTPN